MVAWFITLPASAAVGAACELVARLGGVGLALDAVVGAAVIAFIYRRSRRMPTDQTGALEVDLAANAVLSRKNRRVEKKRASKSAVAGQRMSREATMRRMDELENSE